MALGGNQLLLRGASLKNTDYVYGAVVYAGQASKIMMNSNKSRIKTSKIEKTTYIQIVRIFVLQVPHTPS